MDDEEIRAYVSKQVKDAVNNAWNGYGYEPDDIINAITEKWKEDKEEHGTEQYTAGQDNVYQSQAYGADYSA
jgi:bifunctional pyridoxal-dependent enzyme with beta-cystathionase and maltose regulon repressor activities